MSRWARKWISRDHWSLPRPIDARGEFSCLRPIFHRFLLPSTISTFGRSRLEPPAGQVGTKMLPSSPLVRRSTNQRAKGIFVPTCSSPSHINRETRRAAHYFTLNFKANLSTCRPKCRAKEPRRPARPKPCAPATRRGSAGERKATASTSTRC